MRTRPLSFQYALFPVKSAALGPVWFGVVWTDNGIAGLTFPEAKKGEVKARLSRSWPNAKAVPKSRAPRAVTADVERVLKFLKGGKSDLGKVRLDLGGAPEFHRRVYEHVRRVPPGRVRSYGEVAIELGRPGAARAVGQAMARNPVPLIVPCHRVLASSRAIGGFTAPGGTDTKLKLLVSEGFQAPGPLSFPRGIDPAVVLASRSRELARLIKRIGPFRLKATAEGGPYEALFRAIIYQQLNGRAAATILGRVKDRFGGEFPTPAEILSAKESDLRAAGLSRNKWLALRDLAEKTQDGLVPGLAELKKMDDEAIIERLTQIRGIGRWTVEMLLIFRLRRPDVWPVDDYAIRASFARLFGLSQIPKAKEIRTLADAWRPFRSVASWYLWRSLDPTENAT